MSDVHPNLVKNIDQTVDNMITMLKSQIIAGKSGDGPEPRRGIWDRFKNWMSNMWYGRYSNRNPYYFMNTLGDFAGSSMPPKPSDAPEEEKDGDEGKKESFCPKGLSLSEYHEIRSLFEDLERELSVVSEAGLPPGAENLRIIRLLDDWGKNLKLVLKKIMTDHSRTTPETTPPIPRSKEESDCLANLDSKHREGAISDDEYEKIKLMLRHGRVEMACKALSDILDKTKETKPDEESPKEEKPEDEKPEEEKPSMTPEVRARIDKAYSDLEIEHNRPGTGNAMPDDIYNRIKSELQRMESSPSPDLKKLSDLEREITGISSDEPPPPPPPDVEADDESKFPYNKGSDLGSFLSIKRELRSKSSPGGSAKSFGEMFEEWESNVGKRGKKAFLELEKDITELLDTRPDGFEPMYDELLKKYKRAVARIVHTRSEEIEHDIEEWATPTSHLSLREKTNYYRFLLRGR